MVKRIIVFLLVMSMLLTALPMTAFANSSEQGTGNAYTDVRTTDWFYGSVMYCLENGIFSGTGEDTFSPGISLTRAMYVTVLGRITGIDTSQYSTSEFKDVAEDAWYAPYVAWAAETGITNGTGKDTFSPDKAITREQMATMTARYFEYFNISFDDESQAASEPKDASKISSWAIESVLRLWNAGLFVGDKNGNFNPASNATRAEAAAFCMRVSNMVQQQKDKDKPTEDKPTEEKPTENQPTSSTGSGSSGGGGGGGGSSGTSYTITFETNGGNPISALSMSAGTRLGTLPVPFKLGAIFDGWFYDSQLNNKVRNTDVLTRSLTLYAKFTDTGAPTQNETPQYASALDQAPDFSIVVIADGKSQEEVKAGIVAENLYDPDQTDIITVNGSGNSFTVSAKNGTFDEGASYKLTLVDDALRFNGYADTVRTFTFSIAKQEVLNLRLSDKMKYLPRDDVSDITKDGSSVSRLSIPLATLGTDIQTVNYNEGTFTYDGVPGFEVGDVIALYEGVRPDQRNINDDSGDGAVAYVEITEVNGTTYSYKTANGGDVLFKPDVLPVNIADDEDNDPVKLTIDIDKMFFGDDKYAELNLDADTKVDEGDFISFYSGEFGPATMASEGYGQITAVAMDDDDNYIITFIPITQDQLLSACGLYDTGTLDGEELLAGTDIAALEASIEAQAMANGFAEQAAEYLTALALQTDSFTELGKNMKLENFIVTAENGTPLSRSAMMSLAKVETKLSDLYVNASIGYWLPHFKVSGTSCNVTVSFKLTLGSGDNAVVIRVSGTFVEEVKINTSLSVDIKWKWYAFIPVPVDFVAEAGFEFYTYTGINIQADIYTKEKPGGMNIGPELEKLIESADSQYNKEAKDTLIEKYQQMLENDTDWIELFNKEIFNTEGGIDPFHIVAYSIKLEFVVALNVNVTIGCNFSHTSAKGYYYSISLANKTATSSQADLIEEREEFTFYVLGTIGIRAGVKLTLEIGLFSVELDSIGISAEVGVYVQLWGYFYYKYTYSASAGKEEQCAGALYIELGIYLEIKFFAQALDELYQYETDIYSNEWPLWSAGSEESVLDFAYDASEVSQLTMCGKARTLKLDDNRFMMKQMNMKTGDDTEALYDDASDFTIEITNSAFAYDASTNKLTVAPPEGVSKLTGEMIITWKDAPLVFTSSPISRSIPLYWDTPVGSVAVVPYDIEPTADTEPSYMYSVINGQSFDLPTDLKNPTWWENEYIFGGWYRDADFTQPQSLPFIMPEGVESITLYAKWTPNDHFPYYIQHLLEPIDGIWYILDDTQTLYGTARTLVDLPDARTYVHYTFDDWNSKKLFITAEQGYYDIGIPKGVSKYYYALNSHKVTFHMLPDNENDIEMEFKYGRKITPPYCVRTGYDFDGWDKEIPETMPDEDGLEFSAKWVARTDTPFKVEHYVEKPGSAGGYTFISSEKKTGTTDKTLTASDYQLSSDLYSYDHATVKGQTVTEATLSADGSLLIKLYYKYSSDTANYTVRHVRESISGSYSESEGAVVFEETNIGKIGEKTEAEPRHYGTYKGFTPGPFSQMTIAADGSTVVTIYYERNSYTVTWNAGEGTFDDGIETVIQEDGSEAVIQSVKFGVPIERPENTTMAGMVFTGWEGGVDLGPIPTIDSLIMPADENLVYYARYETPAEGDEITVIFEYCNGQEPEERQLTVGQSYGELPTPTLDGYTFAGWYTDIADKPITSEMTVTIAVDHTLHAYWIPNSYEIMYWLDGGVNHPDNPDSYTLNNSVISLKEPTRNGHIFLGWIDFYDIKVEADEAIPVGTRGYVWFEAVWEPEN